MNSPAEDVKDILNDSSSVGLTFGTDLFCFVHPDSPDLSAVVKDSGGFPPTPNYRLDYPTIQILVRGKRGGYQDAYDLAEDIKECLRAVQNQTVNGTTYIGIWVMSEPFPLPPDGKGRPRLTMNFRLQRTE